MLKQLLVSVVVIVAAAAAYVFLVPGSTEMLARIGIAVPGAATAEPAATAPAGGQQQARQAQGAGQAGQRPGGGRGGRGNQTMVVVTAAVTTGKINDKLTALGEGAAAQSVTVMAPASGTLDELVVKPGDVIKAGAVIGQLDADAEQIAFERATVAQRDAAAALKRTEELAAANSATTVQLNAAQLAATNADLEVRNARLALDRRTITSPIGGTVGLFQVSAGNQVNAQSVVTTIEDTSHIVISFWVPERYASMISPGLPVAASPVALPGETMAGTVSAVDNRIDPASRTLKVEARIDNDGRLRPGMSFSVTMEFPGEEFPTVDPLAIQWSSNGAYLWKYAENKVERVPVSIIQRNSDGVLVKAALQPGDQVVVQGVQQLSEGATVRLLDEPVAEAGGGQREGRAPAGSAL
ncbi:MAG TPA: efflux RND transporter periplasmic adaptor subunit [Devosia sp.]